MPDSTPTPKAETPTVVTPADQEPMGELPPVVEVGMPGFRRLQEDEPWTDRAAAAWPPGGGDGAVPGATSESATGPTTTETGPSQGSIGDTVLKAAAMAVGMATMLLHAWRTPGEDNQVWQATEEEMADMAGPIARIVDRRVPKSIGGNSDVGDALDFGMAATAYSMRNIDEERAWKAREGYVPHVVDTTATERPPAAPAENGDAEPAPDPLDALRGTRR